MNTTNTTLDDAGLTNTENTDTRSGVVIRKSIGTYHVYIAGSGSQADRHNGNGRTITCSISTLLRKQLIYPIASPHSVRYRVQEVKTNQNTDPLAIGDLVRLIDAGDGTGHIIERLPRDNRLVRPTAVPMPSAHAFEQVIVANLDQVVAVFAAAKPKPKWNMLDRYLVSCESSELPALICIAKLDLIQGDERRWAELEKLMEEYRRIGYPVILTSALTGAGLDQLSEALSGRTSVLVGKSGVGKTSLLNALQPDLGQRVSEVSRATGKGRHTTSHLEMFHMAMGGAVVDTPGVREFGLWQMEDGDLGYHFPEMRAYIGKCKFRLDCQHDEEPGCAVRDAVLAGEISPRRYQNYMRLKAEIA